MSERDPLQQEKNIDKEARLVNSLTEDELDQLYALLRNSRQNLDTPRNIFRKAAETMQTATGSLKQVCEGILTSDFTGSNLERNCNVVRYTREQNDIGKLSQSALDAISADAAKFMKKLDI